MKLWILVPRISELMLVWKYLVLGPHVHDFPSAERHNEEEDSPVT
jgi:hypothetical protein